MNFPKHREAILEKIKNGKVKVAGREKKPMKPKPKLPVSDKVIEAASNIQAEGAAHIEDIESAGTEALDETPKPKAAKPKKTKETKVEKKPKEPKAPKVAVFPIKRIINKYGFIGLTVGICNALGLPMYSGKGSQKLTHDIKVSLESWNSETRELTIKIS